MAKVSLILLVLCAVIARLQAIPIQGDKWQGDIMLTPYQRAVIERKISPRTGQSSLFWRWPKNDEGYVIVPFRLDPSYSKES